MIDDEFEVCFELYALSRACKTPHADGACAGVHASPLSRGRKKSHGHVMWHATMFLGLWHVEGFPPCFSFLLGGFHCLFV
jgi:hypothetical protein